MSDPSLLRDREFVRYLAARGLSGTGSMATYIALPVLVYRTSDDPGLTALVAALEAAPYLLFGLLAGALTDRWNRKRVMIAADLLGAAVLASIPLAAAAGEVTVPHILVVAFLGPTIGVFFDGAVFGAIPLLVGRGRIAEANSYAWSLQSAIEIVAPAVVGATLAVVDPAWLLGLDSVYVRAERRPALPDHPPDVGPGARARPADPRPGGARRAGGARFLVHHEGVRSMTVIGTLLMLSIGGYMALTVVWLDRVLHLGTEGWRFGITYMAWAIGGLAASVTIPRLVRFVSPARIALVAVPVAAGLGVVTSRVTVWWVAALLYVGWAAATTLVVVNSISYRQAVTPEHLQGRVNTAGRMLSWGIGWTGGAFLSGLLVEPLGLRPTMLFFASVSVLAAVFAWASPLRRIASAAPAQRVPAA